MRKRCHICMLFFRRVILLATMRCWMAFPMKRKLLALEPRQDGTYEGCRMMQSTIPSFKRRRVVGDISPKYISHWSQRGKEHAHARNLVNEVRGVLMSGDILYEIPAEKETFSVAIGFITGAITADDFGRIAFATVLFFVAIAMVHWICRCSSLSAH